MAKLFTVRGHSPFFFQKSFTTPWADVWLQTSNGKSRRLYFSPCLISRYDLRGEVILNKRLAEDTKNDPELSGVYDSEIAECESYLTRLDNGERFICDKIDVENLEDVYTSSLKIDRDEAEAMIKFYLIKKGYCSVKLRWKRPKYLFGQVSFGDLNLNADLPPPKEAAWPTKVGV